MSNYRNEFKSHVIKKEAMLSIGAKDHLNSKENGGGKEVMSEYQRRYDSVIEQSKGRGRESLALGVYRKEPVIQRRK